MQGPPLKLALDDPPLLHEPVQPPQRQSDEHQRQQHICNRQCPLNESCPVAQGIGKLPGERCDPVVDFRNLPLPVGMNGRISQQVLVDKDALGPVIEHQHHIFRGAPSDDRRI